MPDDANKQPTYVIRWTLGILSGILIAIVLGGSALLLQVDKAQTVQEVKLSAIEKTLDNLNDKLEPIVGNNTSRVSGLERDVDDIKFDVRELKESVDQLDETVKLVGRNIENRIKNPDQGNP